MLDVYTTTGSVDEEVFLDFLEKSVLPHLLPFNGVNPHSVLLMDNASIHHTDRVISLIQSTGALLHFIPPYSPDLNPIEECFSKVKAFLKEHDNEMQADNVEDCLMQAFVLYPLMTVPGGSTMLVICHELDLLYEGPL